MRRIIYDQEYIHSIIKNIQKEINKNINFLNSGGCGIFCYHMSVWLDKYHIPHEITALDKIKPKSFSYNKGQFNKGNRKSISASHVVIKLFNQYFDGYMYYEKSLNNNLINEYCGKIWPPPIGKYTQDEIFRSTEILDDWNNTYNRKQTPKLIKILNKHTL